MSPGAAAHKMDLTELVPAAQGINLHALRGEWEAHIRRKAHKDRPFPRWTLLEDGTAIDDTGQRPADAQLQECVLCNGAVEVKRTDGWCINMHKSSLAHLIWERAGCIVEWVRVEASTDSREKFELKVERDCKRKFAKQDSPSQCSSQSSSSRESARGRRLSIVGAEKKPRLDCEEMAGFGIDPALQGKEPESPLIWERRPDDHADPSIRLKLFDMVKSGQVAAVQRYLKLYPSMAHLRLTGNQHGSCAGQSLVFAAVQSSENSFSLCRLLVDSYGLDPNHRDAEQRSPIFYLIRSLGNLHQQLACLKYLLNKRKTGEDFDRHQFTPLFSAAYLGRVAFIYELVTWGSEINWRDAFGNTAARYAREPQTVAALLNCGADLAETRVMLQRQANRSGATSALEYFECLSPYSGKSLPDAFSFVFRPDGSMYAVMIAQSNDREAILRLESEFVHDHMDLWPSLSREQVIQEVGVPLQQLPREAFGCLKGSQVLKCLHLPPRDGTDIYPSPKVVGYLLMSITYNQDRTGGHVNISHLKVDNKHQKRNCGSLMLLGALRQIGAQIDRHFDLKQKPWNFCLTLAVTEDNATANALYEQMGFKVITKKKSKKGLQWHGLKKEAENGFYTLRREWAAKVHRGEVKAWGRAKTTGGGSSDQGSESEVGSNLSQASYPSRV